MTTSNRTPRSVSGHPLLSLAAFAALRARLGRPFADRSAELERVGLTEAALAEVEAHWVAVLLRDTRARAEFEQAFQSEQRRPQPSDDAEPVHEASSSETSALDATLPVGGEGALVVPTPFKPGEFLPPPPLPLDRARRTDDDALDATLLPIALREDTLPFTLPSPRLTPKPGSGR